MRHGLVHAYSTSILFGFSAFANFNVCLPYQANIVWFSTGWDSLSQIQNRSVSNARSIWRYKWNFRIKHLVNLQIPVSPEQVHCGEPTWNTPNNISKVSPRETAETKHIASRATRYNLWPWLASLFSSAVCSKLPPLLIFPFETLFSCSWPSMVASVSFLVRESLSSASIGWFSWSTISQLDAIGEFDCCPGETLLFKKDMNLSKVVTTGVLFFAFPSEVRNQQSVRCRHPKRGIDMENMTSCRVICSTISLVTNLYMHILFSFSSLNGLLPWKVIIEKCAA